MEEEEYQLAVVQIGDEKYALDIMRIKEIIRPLPITPIRKAPGFMEGIINLRGEVIPIIDMRKRMGVNPKGDNKERIVIVVIDKRRMGIIVDEASEVISVISSDIQSAPALSGQEGEYFLGVCKYGNELLIILDLDKILTTRERIEIKALKKISNKS